MAIDPTLLNPGSDASVPFDQFTASYDDAIRNADSQVSAAQGRYKSAEAAIHAIDPNKLTSQDALKEAQAELAKAATVVEQASAAASRARELKGAAIERYSQRGNIPQELRDRYAAMAQVERATAAQKQAEVAEFLNAAPNRREEVRAHTQEAVANATVAQAKADLASATTDIQKQQAQTAYDQAVATLGRTQIDNKNAGYQSQITAAQAAVAPEIAQAQASKARSEATVAGAQAAVAPQAAQAAVDQAQANINKTNQEIADLQRQARQAPTDAQAQQAIQTQISQKQTELQAAQLQLQQAQKLMPLAVAGAEQTLQKNTLGALYGLQDRAKAIADALRSGQITDPAVAQQQLQDYITTTIQGTTPFERDKFATEQETTRRGQDVSLAGTQTSTFGSGFSSALGTFGKLNDTTPVGSDAAGRGFLASMDLLGNNLKSFAPASMSSPLVSSLRPTTAMPAVPAVTPPITQPGGAIPAGATLPADTGGAGHQITINIGGAGGYQGAANPNAFGSGTGPIEQTPQFLQNQRPATPADVAALWAGDQHYDPTQQQQPAGVM